MAVSVYVLVRPFLLVIWQPLKAATPAAAAFGLVVQVRVLPFGPVPIAKVIELVAPVTTLPPLSSTLTTGWVFHVAPWRRRPAEW